MIRCGPLQRLCRYRSEGGTGPTKPLQLTAARLRVGKNVRGLVRVAAGDKIQGPNLNRPLSRQIRFTTTRREEVAAKLRWTAAIRKTLSAPTVISADTSIQRPQLAARCAVAVLSNPHSR